MEGKIYSKEIDVWSFGAFIYELGKGEPPFNQYKNEESLFEAIAQIDQKPFKVVGRSDHYNDLLQKCMKVNPAQRITMQQVLEHPFLQGAEALKEQWLTDFRAYREFSKKKEQEQEESKNNGFNFQ